MSIMAQAGEFHILALDQITPSPLNPRKVFELTSLAELAASIGEHGLQQPIVVRKRAPDPTRYDYGLSMPHRYSIMDNKRLTDGAATAVAHVTSIDAASEWVEQLNCASYEIVMGERRYRACKMAGLSTIPAIVRTDILTDDQHLELALIENLHRKDIDAIEAAMGYAELSRMGHSYSDIAKMVNLAQPTIANAMRLLDLPESVRAAVQTGQLGATHARALVRYAPFPALLGAALPHIVAGKLPSHVLEKGLPYRIMDYAVTAKTAVKFGYHEPFDNRTVCAKCPFNAYVQDAEGYNHYCLRPDHYAELKKEALAAKRAETKSALATAGVASMKEIPHLKTLPRDSVRSFSERTCPPGCSIDCPCRGRARDYDNKVVAICTDTDRYDKLKKAQEQLEEQARIAKIDAALSEAMAIVRGVETLSDGMSLLLTLTDVDLMEVKAVVGAAKLLGLSAKKAGAGPEMKDLAGDGTAPRAYRARLEPLDLIKLAVGSILISEARSRREWKYGDIARINQFLADQKRLTRAASVPKWRTCPKCRGEMRLKVTNDDAASGYNCACGHSEPVSNQEDEREPNAPTDVLVETREPVPALGGPVRRFWNGEGKDAQEARFHPACYAEAERARPNDRPKLTRGDE